MKKALIIGISGQDGAHLANFLIRKKYETWGTSRNKVNNIFKNLAKLNIQDKLNLLTMNPESYEDTYNIIKKIMPDEIYFLSGQSAVGLSFEIPIETHNSIVLSTINLLESCRKINKDIKIYNAGSGEMFGNSKDKSNEKSCFNPCSPYGAAKATSFYHTKIYRESYEMYACTGIMFNHESSLRPEKFVTQKIIQTVKKIAGGDKIKLELGNINIVRDWGWSPEYVKVMWLMLQNKIPQDFIIATGESNTLESFVAKAFEYFKLDWKEHILLNKNFLRPNELIHSRADPDKIASILNWRAEFKMEDVIKGMIEESDLF